MIFIAIHIGHNATVALSANGEIICALSEERITRVKNSTGFPIESLKFIKQKYLNNSFDKVDKFLFIDLSGLALNYIKKNFFKNHSFSDYGWKKKNKYLLFNSIYKIIPNCIFNIILKIKRNISKINNKYINKKKILNELFDIYPDVTFDLGKISFYDHHYMHAFSFCYFSEKLKENDKYLIFTMDGEGDYLSSTVNIFENNNLKIISKNSRDCSLGYLYAETTNYLGLKIFEHEFKVMGMAPYAKKKDAERIVFDLKKLIYLDSHGNFLSKVVSSLFKFEIEKIFKYEKFENICGAIQLFTEQIILEWVSFWINKTSIKSVVLSGGVFMNIKACKEILDHNFVRHLSIVPSASDESLVFGALFVENYKQCQSIKKVENLYLGRSFENEISIFLNKVDKKKYKILKFKDHLELNLYVSNLLKNNKIIARCCEREEWGARALGNRSILANPSDIENVKRINNAIKHRDYWMPFSPTILDSFEKKYLKISKNIEYDASYMTCLFDSTELAQKHLKATIHPVDFTLRPQILKKNQNEIYYDLIEKFSLKTNIGGLLNTSFNLHGLPNVSNYEDALQVLDLSDLRYLILENNLIEKI